jgi:hypothetical protein
MVAEKIEIETNNIEVDGVALRNSLMGGGDLYEQLSEFPINL